MHHCYTKSWNNSAYSYPKLDNVLRPCTLKSILPTHNALPESPRLCLMSLTKLSAFASRTNRIIDLGHVWGTCCLLLYYENVWLLRVFTTSVLSYLRTVLVFFTHNLAITRWNIQWTTTNVSIGVIHGSLMFPLYIALWKYAFLHPDPIRRGDHQAQCLHMYIDTCQRMDGSHVRF